MSQRKIIEYNLFWKFRLKKKTFWWSRKHGGKVKYEQQTSLGAYSTSKSKSSMFFYFDFEKAYKLVI